MSDAVEASGNTVEEAIDRALEMLGATDDEVEVQILSEGNDIVRRDNARVRVRLRDERTAEDLADDEEEAHAGPPPGPADFEGQAIAAEDFLHGLLETMDFDADVSASTSSQAAVVELIGPELGLLIGRHGATLEALQEVTRAAVQRKTQGRAWVNLDIEGYRARKRAMLERQARTAAAKVRKSGRPLALEAMPAFERKVVHDALTDFRGVRTSSEGEEPNRFVVISPVG
jgi:spoIIIJ-associated protein